MSSKQPSVFISYAHKDGMEFARRLAFALSMYMDVFWDRRLQAGPYPPQLLKEISLLNFFLLVMSPHSLSSIWCLREGKHAFEHNRQIALAKIYPECGTSIEGELTGIYTYGDFTEDFEVGFRRLTEMMLGHPYSSWEALPYTPDTGLIECLKKGFIPGLISKEIAEWLIVYRLWKCLEYYLSKHCSTGVVSTGTPHTTMGVLRLCQTLLKQLGTQRDFAGRHLAQQIEPIAELFVHKIMNINDSQHAIIGDAASEICQSVQSVLEFCEIRDRDFFELRTLRAFYIFDVAEKLRELITIHARRSRYLY